MSKAKSKGWVIAALVIAVGVMLWGSKNSYAQSLTPTKSKSVHIQAQAYGTSTQMGRTFNVTVIIEEFSTPDDQKALLAAFTEKGNEGLVNALSKMHTKGRLLVTGTLGYDVSYIREFKQPDGSTKIRLVTNRPLRFGEVWSDSRSTDYNLSGLEIVFAKDKKGKMKGTGTLAPACQFKMDKDNQIELELFQNPWRLDNVMIR